MKPKMFISLVMALTLGVGLACFDPPSGPAFAQSQEYAEALKEIQAPTSEQEFPVPLRPLPKTITPCRACHGPEKDFPVNFKRREDILVHTNIRLNHGGIRLWCLDCHHPDNRNYLLPLSDE